MTIIIPVFNQVATLPDAIDSALNQTIKADVIVVNDGSFDGSLEVAKKYEPKIKVVSQTNKGLSSARNAGIMQDTDEWILFLDADDILLENCVKKIEEEIEKHPEADIIAPSFKEFGILQREVILMPDPKLEDFRTGNRIGYCAAIRKSALQEVGGYSPRMVWGYEDLHLWITLLSRGKKIITIPEALWLYRTKETSMYSDALKHHGELLERINRDIPNAQLKF